jgi:hypothetical protein
MTKLYKSDKIVIVIQYVIKMCCNGVLLQDIIKTHAYYRHFSQHQHCECLTDMFHSKLTVALVLVYINVTFTYENPTTLTKISAAP